ncbi:MAG: MBL fold metallo-hydrolase [Actinomycetota bacterium]|nr:MBL fold metallo-hydrolase [Actinomycetota bacterium]
MFLHQFHLESLGHASYLVGDESTGESLVLDPQRDVRAYFEVARDHGSRIAYAIETHGHNDYLSGISEVAARAPGLSVLASAEGEFGYDHRPVRHGEVIEVGDVAFEVLHTPGHTPEHVSLLVHDRAVGEDPAVLLSGGALLVGDVARPDLLGGAAQTRQSAAAMCEMLQTTILELPDHVEVFPTHVAGSLCGANIGARLSTTIGYERRTNPMLRRLTSEDIFVRECMDLQDLPAVPPYWKRMRARNLAGPALLGTLAEPPALDVAQVAELQAGGAVVLDARQPESFAGGHVPGALNVGLGSSFSTWAGTVVPEGVDVVLVLDRAGDLWEATWQLLRIGYPAPVGWLAEGMAGWRTSGNRMVTLGQLSVHEARDRVASGEVTLLDVRQPGEWREGHAEDATFLTAAELPSRLDEVPRDRPVALICGSGFRSSVATSLLVAEGLDAITVVGGMTAWKAAGLPFVPEP